MYNADIWCYDSYTNETNQSHIVHSYAYNHTFIYETSESSIFFVKGVNLILTKIHWQWRFNNI